jgi:hypothetical protein
MTMAEKDRIDELRVLIEHQTADIQLIMRGLYGDPANNKKGLIHIEDRVKNIERLRDRVLWIGTALIVSVQLVYDYLKAKLYGA